MLGCTTTTENQGVSYGRIKMRTELVELMKSTRFFESVIVGAEVLRATLTAVKAVLNVSVFPCAASCKVVLIKILEQSVVFDALRKPARHGPQ
jgi:hypothetical protein